MRISIAAIGRLKAGPERELYQRYAERVDGAGRAVAIGPLKLIELPESRAASAIARMGDEAARLIAKCDASTGSAARIALDEGGKSMTSTAFAHMLAAHRDAGISELSFLIGGADGHGKAAKDASATRLSLGAMTLPHGLARIVLVEQLYRSITIISGHPYHRA